MPGAPTAVLLGAALVLAGLGFGSPSLLVPGLGLLGLAVACFGWVALAAPSRLVRDAIPGRIVEGEPLRLRIRAAGGRLPLPGGELTDPVLDAPIRVGPRWKRRVDIEVRLRGRGRRRVDAARLAVRDPLGLHTRVAVSEPGGELLVLPRIEPLVVAGRGAAGSSVLAGLDDGGGAGRLDARVIELEIDGLRAHQLGSPASRIHWPAVARTGELIERRLVAGADSAPLVALDTSHPASPDALEMAVRAATSLCWHLARQGGCALLLPGLRRPAQVDADLRGWPAAHARLALVEPSRSGSAPGTLQRAGAVFWITARATPALPAALRNGSGARYLVGPAIRGSGTPAFLVAGCEGRRVGIRSSSARDRRAA